MAKTSNGKRLTAALILSIKMARKTNTFAHWANPLFNILNLTEKSASQYPDLIGTKGRLWRLSNSIKGAGITFFRALRYWPWGIRFSIPAITADVLIISHLTNTTHLTSSSDFYFGGLDKALSKAGFTTHTVLINHCRALRMDEENTRRNGITLLPTFLSPWAEIKLIFTMLAATLTLPKSNGSEEERTFRKAAQLAQFSSRAIGNMRIGTMISKIIKSLSPRVIIHTFEGHGWERIITASAHFMSPSPHVIGYQHAVLPLGPKSIAYRYGNGADPDHIFTVGQITNDQLLQESEFDKIEILGSSKSFPSKKPTEFSLNGGCLIAPEGTINEVMIMAELGIAAAKIMAKQKFILRIHPVLSRQKIDQSLKKLAPYPNNFFVSTASLDEDFLRCSWICYRGSTLVFEGIRSGLRPIYLNPDDAAIYNDPLPAEVSFRCIANTAEDLVEIIKSNKKNPTEGTSEFNNALDFADSYLMPMQPEILIRHLNKVLL